MPAGPLPPDPSELLSASMQGFLRQWREEYDFIVIDSSPVLSVTDAVMLSVEVDAVIIVVRAGQTAIGALRRSRDLLFNVKADVLGVVLNAADLSSADYYYYSTTKYGD
jgi:Mrp family chromosome partitioning ATPase